MKKYLPYYGLILLATIIGFFILPYPGIYSIAVGMFLVGVWTGTIVLYEYILKREAQSFKLGRIKGWNEARDKFTSEINEILADHDHEITDLLKEHEEELEYIKEVSYDDGCATGWDNGYNEARNEVEAEMESVIEREKTLSYDEGYQEGWDNAQEHLIGL